MATPMNFQSLNYGGIAQQEQDARRRYYDSLSSIGGVIKDTGKEYEDYLARKKAEEDEKRKWDNMIAEQEYRKQQDELARKYQEQRDLVADTRYDNEYAIKQNERMLQEGALKNMKGYYGNIDTNGMTPEEIGYIKTIANAPTYADAIKAQDGLNQYRYQEKMYKLQKDQFDREAPGRYADDIVKQSRSRLSKAGVDVGGSYIPKVANSKREYVYDKDSIEKQIELIDAELARLQNIEYDSDGSSSYRQSLINKRASLDRALNEEGYVPEYYRVFGR